MRRVVLYCCISNANELVDPTRNFVHDVSHAHLFSFFIREKHPLFLLAFVALVRNGSENRRRIGCSFAPVKVKLIFVAAFQAIECSLPEIRYCIL